VKAPIIALSAQMVSKAKVGRPLTARSLWGFSARLSASAECPDCCSCWRPRFGLTECPMALRRVFVRGWP